MNVSWTDIFIWLGVAILASAALVWLVALALSRLRKTTGEAEPLYTVEQPKAPYHFIRIGIDPPFNASSRTLEAQSSTWRSAMRDVGERLGRYEVQTVYFVHGTFVGNDPLGIVDTLRSVYPKLSPGLEARLQSMIRTSSNLVTRDVGNFLPDYVALFTDALGGSVTSHDFTWSSGNHHVARLRGTVQLAHSLAEEVRAAKRSKRPRILLIGHSHAGQLFALLSMLLAQNEVAHHLLRVVAEAVDWEIDTGRDLRTLANVGLDFVTLGTPILYRWVGIGVDRRLLHIVNHRGGSHLGGSIKGLLHTRSGDYIQQFGIAGTDAWASSKRDRALNKMLDPWLGRGIDPVAWNENVRKRMRVQPVGETLLVDYLDESRFFPNCIATFFGHGTYTKFDNMLTNARLIADVFYP